MKERGRDSGSASIGNVRSAVEREKTKMRERQRRSITTNIFHGLRKHGGYRLSPRADINEVLRNLAREAGWIIEPDGTTYRSPAVSNGISACAMCGGGRKSAPATPSCSYLGGGAGDCSTTVSPRRDSAVNNLSSGGIPSLSAGSVIASNEGLLALYMCGGAPLNGRGGGAWEAVTAGGSGQQVYSSRDGTVSNRNAPA